MANLGYIVNFEINLGYIMTWSQKTNKTNKEDTHTLAWWNVACKDDFNQY